MGAPASESAGDRVKRHATAKKRLARYLADKSKIKAEPLEKVLLAGITDPKERKKRIEAHAAAVAAKKAVRDKSLKALEANPKLRDRLEQRRREAKEIQMQKAKARSKGQ
ncbi:MAG: hypothetical protein HY744_21240 [Deltaproteobacteria bacterium]|nr:hypothetical protein [Deltaproteobacteria bacterium]